MTPEQRLQVIHTVNEALRRPDRPTSDAWCVVVPNTTANRLDRLEEVARNLSARYLRIKARAEVEREGAEVEGALSSLRDGVLAVLLARGIPVSDAERARVVACPDVAAL